MKPAPHEAKKPEGAPGLRIDKWLWHARLCKTRSLAARLCEAGLVLSNGSAMRPSQLVKAGSTLTLSHGGFTRSITVSALGERRGPAPEARGLYEETECRRSTSREPGWQALLSAEPELAWSTGEDAER